MIPKKPYEGPTSDAPVAVRRQTKKSILMLAISIILYGIAAALYFFSETWTFYTPYSSEIIWEMPLSNGIGFFFEVPRTPTLLIAFIALGTLFLLFSLVASRKTGSKES